jgi:hypothetical protein
MIRFAALALTTLVASSSLADEPMITDRPDFTESSSAVPEATVQIEAGGTYVDIDDAEEGSLGEVLVRWGAVSGLEVRLGVGGFAWFDRAGSDGSGLEAFGIGAKVNLARSASLLGDAEIALIVGAETPTGGEETGADVWTPEAVMALGWDLGSHLSLGANLGVARPTGGPERFTSAWVSGVLGVDLGREVGAFVELYGFNRLEPGGSASVTLQTGLTWGVAQDLQLDTRVARRLTEDGPNLLAGAGLAVRF